MISKDYYRANTQDVRHDIDPDNWHCLVGGMTVKGYVYRMLRSRKCRQCRKPAGHWTGPIVCSCGNPYVNKLPHYVR